MADKKFWDVDYGFEDNDSKRRPLIPQSVASGTRPHESKKLTTAEKQQLRVPEVSVTTPPLTDDQVSRSLTAPIKPGEAPKKD